ncbi:MULTISPECIES: hypothetical protein [Streptomyces]|uniref:Uncharacterized protein n=1 Tax=Streptomyces griseiscabiei TaxID=2993540 RepID=A0ABU4LJP8_9ACTN|nr:MULTISPECIES: hypothetical protein [Streptomyces]MBZ3908243.1 hypothetical protein [Streptomyces griseiscabiei]MDX2915655.1 hypothetical protein [Streptomyces griseiscabiei]
MTELATATQTPAIELEPSVWILESGEDNEGGSIKGVYTDRNLAADDFLDLVRDLTRYSRLDVDQSGEDPATGDLYVHGGCDWISLTRYSVTTRRQLR